VGGGGHEEEAVTGTERKIQDLKEAYMGHVLNTGMSMTTQPKLGADAWPNGDVRLRAAEVLWRFEAIPLGLAALVVEALYAEGVLKT
jgi:hypothetical protein